MWERVVMGSSGAQPLPATREKNCPARMVVPVFIVDLLRALGLLVEPRTGERAAVEPGRSGRS